MKYYKVIFILFLTTVCSFSQPEPHLNSAQTDATFYPSGVWHKNMELKCNQNFSYQPANEFIDIREVKTFNTDNTLHKNYKIISTAINPDNRSASATTKSIYEKASYIELYDVNNLNNGLNKVCQIRVIKSKDIYDNPDNYYNLTYASMYQNPSNNHTYCVIGKASDPFIISNSQNAIAIIIDLTEALALVDSKSDMELIISDLTTRNSVYAKSTPSDKRSNIYIGYVSFLSQIPRIHTMGFDNPTGILSISPSIAYRPDNVQKPLGYFDLLYFGNIQNHDNYTSTSLFVEPDRISTSGINSNTPIQVNIVPLETKVGYKSSNGGVIDNKNIDITIAGYSLELKRFSDEYYRNGYIIKMSMNLESHKLTTDTTHKVNIQIDEEKLKYAQEIEKQEINDIYNKLLPKTPTGFELKIQSHYSLRNILQNIISK